MLHHNVRNNYQDKADAVLEEPCGSGIAEVEALQALAVRISIQHICHIVNGRRIEIENLVEIGGQQLPDLQDEQGQDRAADARQRDMPDFLQLLRAVPPRRLIQVRVDGRDRRDVDDRAPSRSLPDIGQYQHAPEDIGIRQEVHRPPAHHPQEGIDRAVQRQHIRNQGRGDDPGDEMGQVGCGLEDLPDPPVADLADENRKDNGHRPTERQVHQADDQCVRQHLPEGRRLEQLIEIFEARPGAPHDPLPDFEILEGQYDSIHGLVSENKEKYHEREQQQIISPVLINPFQQPLPGCPRLVLFRYPHAVFSFLHA